MITFKRLSMNRPGNSAPPKMEADPSRRPFSLRRGYVFTASGTRSAGFSGCRIAALSSLQSLAFLFQGGDHGRGRRQECRRYGRLESLRYATLNTYKGGEGELLAARVAFPGSWSAYVRKSEGRLCGKRTRLTFAFLVLQLALLCPRASAYPPGPYQLIYGTVRDQYGRPLASSQTKIVLQTPSGAQLSVPVLPGISLPGVNYVLKVPLDSGVTPDPYRPGVLVPAASVKLLVVIDTVTNLPIEMTKALSLGRWAQNTRVDLTLGTDTNGDGIPDAWELAYLASVGLNLPLSAVNANTVVPPNGKTLLQEYLGATSVKPPAAAPEITFAGFTGISPILQFSTATGRSYSVLGSPDLRIWSSVAFHLSTDAPGAPARTSYAATGNGAIQVYLAPPPLGEMAQFYRILVQ